MSTPKTPDFGRTPFHQVLRDMGYHSLAAKYGASIRPAPVVSVDRGSKVRVTSEGTFAVQQSAARFRSWRARKWD